MISKKTLSLPVLAALIASTAGPARADIGLYLSSEATYRQKEDKAPGFYGGTFKAQLRDGAGNVVGGCARPLYWPPNIPLDPCPGGATAYILFGTALESNPGPYFWMSDVIPALVVQSRRPELCLLKAAPASDLPRPYAGFKDDSLGIYYNLLDPANVREYVITRYDFTRNYKANERQKLQREIVPGVYHFSFPRLNNPTVRVPISPVIYPMPEGLAEKNQQKEGVRIGDSQNWTKSGFMELSYIKPNIIQWSGFDPAVVHAGVDTLYFSMRYLSNPDDPTATVSYYDPVRREQPASVFPSYVSGSDPRIQLATPFINTFTLPPVFRSGTTAVIELELQRAFNTGGVSFDLSNRKFQIPVMIVNRYSEYQGLRFPETSKKTELLDDYDNDGFNNLTEWILGSRGEDPQSVPVNPVPSAHADVINSNGEIVDPAYFGFTVIKQRQTRPNNIRQILQYSTNGGKTWKRMRTDANWLVTETGGEIRVESQIYVDFFTQVQPPAAVGHIYRMKITLGK